MRDGTGTMFRAGILAAMAALGAAFGVMLFEAARTSQAAAEPPAAATRDERIGEFAKAALRARLQRGEDARFSDVAVVRFGPEDERAVCGRVQLATGGGPVRFVMRVVLPRAGGPEQSRGQRRWVSVLEQGPGGPMASRDVGELYCRPPEAVAAAAVDATLAKAASSVVVAPAPAAPAPAATPAPATPAAATPAAAPVRPGAQSVLVVSPARLRSAPNGGADVLRIAGRGEQLAVHGRAEGGWLQVGNGGPEGWIHSSLLEERQ